MPEATQEQVYEQSLSSTVILDVAIVAAVFIIFPVFRIIFPHVYAPQQHLPREKRTILRQVFWYADVFMQPLTTYAQRGNMATIFAIFSLMMIVVCFILGTLALTVLFPIYYYGTDQSRSVNYLTFWSMGTIAHLARGSFMNLVPMVVVVVFSVVILLFYYQFTVIYSFFRQRCLRRTIYQNYTVLLQNIPEVINEKRELLRVLRAYDAGIKGIVPIPKRSYKLSGLNNQFNSSRAKFADLDLSNQLMKARFYQQQATIEALLRAQPVNRRRLAKARKAQAKVSDKILRQNEKKKALLRKQKELILNVQKIIFKDNIDVDYVFQNPFIPVKMPVAVQPCFEYTPQPVAQQQTIYPFPKDSEQLFGDAKLFDIKRMRYKAYKKAKEVTKRSSSTGQRNSNPDDVEQMGTGAFLICESQYVAANKRATLLTNNSARPSSMMAPPIQEVNWKAVGLTKRSKILRYTGFAICYIILFLAYIFGYTYIMSFVYKITADEVFEVLCGHTCVFDDKDGPGACSFCQTVSKLVVTLIPTVLNVIINMLIPIFINAIVKFLNLSTLSAEQNVSYRLLFIFLLLIVGIVQIIFPTFINQITGNIDFSIFNRIDFQEIVQNLGTNIVDQQFYFINYIINKYFTFPLFTLANFSGIISFLLAKIFGKNSFKYTNSLKFSEFNFTKEFAYISHMFVVSLIFSISAPMVNVIVFIVFLGMVTIDRYVLLNVATPGLSSDMSSESKILLMMGGDIFLGLCFMIIALAAFYFVEQQPIYTAGFVICIITLAVCIVIKIRIDNQYRRSLGEITQGDYIDASAIFINPEHIPDVYEPEDNYSARFSLSNEEDLKFLKRKGLLNKHGGYKMGCIDKWLKSVHMDLSKLPISYLRLDGINFKTCERRCRLLSDEQLQVTPISEEGVNRCMIAYTHPALVQAIYEISNKATEDHEDDKKAE